MIDLHTHTTYCDGKNTPREMVLAALEMGMEGIGFSGHSFTSFDTGWCMSKRNTARYRKEIAALKKEFSGKIDIFCGIEQDYDSEETTEGYDYVIGSVHYLTAGGVYLPVDESPEAIIEAVGRYFDGDPLSFAEAYFEKVGNVVERTGADIIGHFDLLTKFREKVGIFDESHPRYIAAWKNAADKLLAAGRVFEINTGAVSRGYRKTPYPSEEILSYLKEKGATLRLTGDSHSARTLCYGFDEFRALCPRETPAEEIIRKQ